MSEKLFSENFLIETSNALLETPEQIAEFHKTKNDFFNESLETQLFFFFKKEEFQLKVDFKYFNVCSHYAIHNYSEYTDKICVSRISYKMSVNNKPYIKSTETNGFTYNKQTKKIKFWFGGSISNSNIKMGFIFPFLRYIKCDWFDRMPSNYKYLINKTMLEGIVSGKITNQTLYIKKWLSTSVKYKFSPKYINKLFDKNYSWTNNWNNIDLLYNIRDCCLSPENTLRQIADGKLKSDYLNILNDMFLQSKILKTKINTNWSFKRLKNEHSKMTKRISQLIMEQGLIGNSTIQFFGELNLPDGSDAFLITSEKECYMEALEQSHCLYTNYWRSIENKTYFALSVNLPERCTVGIYKIWTPNDTIKFGVNQIYKCNNEPVKPETKKFFVEWMNGEDVQDYFNSNYNTHTFNEYERNMERIEKERADERVDTKLDGGIDAIREQMIDCVVNDRINNLEPLQACAVW